MESYLGDKYGMRPDHGHFSVIKCGRARPPIGQITVGWYWALMLNATQVVFVDIDNRHALSGILSITDEPITDELDDQNPEQPGTKLRAFLDANRDWGFRIYQTAAGYRYLCTTHELDPRGDPASAVLAELGADKMYAELCRERGSFRARLTAKPWRMLAKSFLPWTSQYWGRKRFALTHIQDYLKSARSFAACRFMRTVGRNPKRLTPGIRRIIEVHDKFSSAHEFKPLA
jgi:hypothetical protein